MMMFVGIGIGWRNSVGEALAVAVAVAVAVALEVEVLLAVTVAVAVMVAAGCVADADDVGCVVEADGVGCVVADGCVEGVPFGVSMSLVGWPCDSVASVLLSLPTARLGKVETLGPTLAETPAALLVAVVAEELVLGAPGRSTSTTVTTASATATATIAIQCGVCRRAAPRGGLGGVWSDTARPLRAQ